MTRFQLGWKGDAALVPDESILEEICSRLCARENLIDILRDEEMPTLKIFYRWIGMYPAWRQAYHEALEVKMHGLVEETISIADNTNPKLVKKAELQVKARQWAAERLNRGAFGDPKSLTVNGNVSITHNSIHQLLTAGTETRHLGVVDNKQEVYDAQGSAEEAAEVEITARSSGTGGSAGGSLPSEE